MMETAHLVRAPDTLAALAQSVEHLTRNEKVASSILAGGSLFLPWVLGDGWGSTYHEGRV